MPAVSRAATKAAIFASRAEIVPLSVVISVSWAVIFVSCVPWLVSKAVTLLLVLPSPVSGTAMLAVSRAASKAAISLSCVPWFGLEVNDLRVLCALARLEVSDLSVVGSDLRVLCALVRSRGQRSSCPVCLGSSRGQRSSCPVCLGLPRGQRSSCRAWSRGQ